MADTRPRGDGTSSADTISGLSVSPDRVQGISQSLPYHQKTMSVSVSVHNLLFYPRYCNGLISCIFHPAIADEYGQVFFP